MIHFWKAFSSGFNIYPNHHFWWKWTKIIAKFMTTALFHKNQSVVFTRLFDREKIVYQFWIYMCRKDISFNILLKKELWSELSYIPIYVKKSEGNSFFFWRRFSPFYSLFMQWFHLWAASLYLTSKQGVSYLGICIRYLFPGEDFKGRVSGGSPKPHNSSL